jgi:hypothetical protein
LTERPDDGAAISRKQIAATIGVSNVAAITKAIDRLGLSPVDEAHTTMTRQQNGGRGTRIVDTPLFDASVAELIRAELREHAVDRGDGSFEYAGQGFRWR